MRPRLVLGTAACLTLAPLPTASSTGVPPPPANAAFDYQIGGDYRPPRGVRVVSRDWFSGRPLRSGYSICYVNAFQTQADERGAHRPDEHSNWPAGLVLDELGDDPNWGGEYLVDISQASKRRRALHHVAPMIDRCAAKGFDAVEFDNLDSWTRFDGTPLAGRVPFGRAEAVAYAAMLTDRAHRAGLAAAQKNTPQLSRRASRRVVGFDFAVAEECGRYRECRAYTSVFGRHVVVIEYTRAGFHRACASVGARVSVVLRDVDVSRPRSPSYRSDGC